MKTQSCFWLQASNSVIYFVCAVALTVISPLSFAAKSFNVQETLSSLRFPAVSATVIVLPKYTAYITKVTPDKLPQYGCTYLYESPTEVASLIDVLSGADLRRGDELTLRNLRFSLTFTNKEGRASTLLLDQLAGSDRIVNGLLDGEPLGADENLPEAIRGWVARNRVNAKAVTGLCVE